MKNHFFAFLMSMYVIIGISHAQNLAPIAKPADTLRLSVYFDFGKYTLREQDEKKMQLLAQQLSDFKLYRIYMQGSTDDIGSDIWNEMLSKNRCFSVQNYLLTQGVSLSSFWDVKGLGEQYPLVENSTEDNRQRNRRVDMMVLYHLPIENEPIAEIASFSTQLIQNEIIDILSVKNPSQDANEVREMDKTSLSDYLRSLSYKSQEKIIDVSKENIVKTASGIWVYIPENAFEGVSPLDNVSLEIQEFTERGNMMLAGLFTITDNKQTLETGGMLNILASSNGKKLSLKKGKRMSISIPKRRKNKSGMRIFASNTSGNNWILVEDAKAIQKAGDAISANEYQGKWGLPVSAGNELKNLQSNYCKVCEEKKPIPFEKPQKKYVKFMGHVLFSFFSPFEQKEYDKKVADFLTERNENLKEDLKNNGFNSCTEMKQKLIVGIKETADFADWYLGIFPTRTALFEFIERKNTYSFTGINLGWTNCDRYAGFEGETITLKIDGGVSKNTIIRVMMKEDDVSLPVYSLVPKDKDLYIIAIKKVEEKIYLSLTETKSDSETKKLKWEEVTEKELVEKVNKING